MSLGHYKTKRKGQPKRESKLSDSKSRMLANAKVLKNITSPKLCEAYYTKIEWMKKVVPKLKE
jgi:hypothetical protein